VGTGVASLTPATPKVTRAEESPSAINKTHGNRNGKTGDKDRTNQKVVDTVQAEKSPGRVDLKSRLAQSGKRSATEARWVVSGLETAMETLKRLIQFSEQHRNTHREIK